MQCPQCRTENPDGARFCLSCGFRLGQAVPERRLVTILFADVEGSTSLAEGLDPEDVMDIMNGAFEFLVAPIRRQDGTVARLMGDAILAFFGAPVAHEDDPERAIRAALEIQNEIHGYAERLARERGIEGFAARVGINTGLVVAGEVGSSLRVEYTAMGDAVNLAARMEQNAPPGGILITHDTYRHVRGVFDVQPQAPFTVKGRSEPVQTYLVLRAKPRVFRAAARGVEGVETRMVGRDAELLRLQDALRTAIEERELQAVTVTGEAGVGKSRLLYEFENWLELQPERVRVFKGRASEELSRLPHGLLRDVFAARFEILDSDPPAVARDKLERGIAGFMPGDAEAVLKAHFVGHLIGLDFSESPHLRGILSDPQQIRDRALHYLARFFAAAAVTPLPPLPRVGEGEKVAGAALLLEDLHWADEGSLDAVAHLMDGGRDSPLFIAALARPELFERRPKWGEGLEGHTRVDLQPLSKRNSRRLVAEILRKAPEVPEALQELVVGASEGNPFYAEELIKMLIEAGVIVPGEEAWAVEPGRLAGIQVPPTLLGVLQVRLDGLAPLRRETLQQASVVGRVFWDQALAYIQAPEAEGRRVTPELSEALGELRRKELIFSREESAFVGAEEYLFKHALLREATYETVLKRQRRAYHAQAAAWLIEKSGERADEYAGLIAEHFERAGDVAHAAGWYGRAGRQAGAAYAAETAIGHYQKALELARAFEVEHSRKMAWYHGLGEVLTQRGRIKEAIAAYDAMRQAADAAGDAIAEALAWNWLSASQWFVGDFGAALDSAQRGEAAARAGGEAGRAQLAHAAYRQGRAYATLGDPARALARVEDALELCAGLPDTPEVRQLQKWSLQSIGYAHSRSGRFEQAARYGEQALAVASELDDRRAVTSALNLLGENARLRGDYRAAADYYQAQLAIARETGTWQTELVSLSNLGGAQVGLGEYAAAEATLRQALAMAGRTHWAGSSETYRFLAEACLGQGKVSEAWENARRALALGQETGAPELLGGAWRVIGEAGGQWSVASGQWGETGSGAPGVTRQRPGAEDEGAGAGDVGPGPGGPGAGGDEAPPEPANCFAESARVFAEIGWEPERARTLRAWARYELTQGDGDKGAAMWLQARDTFARLEMQLEVERMDGERHTNCA